MKIFCEPFDLTILVLPHCVIYSFLGISGNTPQSSPMSTQSVAKRNFSKRKSVPFAAPSTPNFNATAGTTFSFKSQAHKNVSSTQPSVHSPDSQSTQPPVEQQPVIEPTKPIVEQPMETTIEQEDPASVQQSTLPHVVEQPEGIPDQAQTLIQQHSCVAFNNGPTESPQFQNRVERMKFEKKEEKKELMRKAKASRSEKGRMEQLAKRRQEYSQQQLAPGQFAVSTEVAFIKDHHNIFNPEPTHQPVDTQALIALQVQDVTKNFPVADGFSTPLNDTHQTKESPPVVLKQNTENNGMLQPPQQESLEEEEQKQTASSIQREREETQQLDGKIDALTKEFQEEAEMIGKTIDDLNLVSYSGDSNEYGLSTTTTAPEGMELELMEEEEADEADEADESDEYDEFTVEEADSDTDL